mgnify:CR=1 FL=1
MRSNITFGRRVYTLWKHTPYRARGSSLERLCFPLLFYPLSPPSKKNPPLEGRTFEGRIAKGEEEGLSLVLATEDIIGISLFDIFEGIELSHRSTTDRLGDRVADVAGWIGLLQTD